MAGEVENAPMYRHEGAGIDVVIGLDNFFGEHVRFRPARVPAVDFDEGKVKGTVFGANVLEMLAVAAIAADEHPSPLPFQDIARPQAGVAGVEGSARIVKGALRRDAESIFFKALAPAHFVDAFGGYAPFTQVRANPQRNDETGIPPTQGAHGRVFQMVVMVMGDEHVIQFGQLLTENRRVTEAAHDAGQGRGIAEYRVDQQTLAFQFDDERGMSQPVGSEGRCIVSRRRKGIGVQRDLRQGGFWRVRVGQQEAAPAGCPAARNALRVVGQFFRTLEATIFEIRQLFVGGDGVGIGRFAQGLQQVAAHRRQQHTQQG